MELIKKYLKWIIIGGAAALIIGGGIFLTKHFVDKKHMKIEPKELISISESSSVNVEDVAIIAHRGLSSIAPENTVQSINEAVKAGINMVEFDISESRDAIPVLMHDDTVDRMTDGVGKVKNFTYYELLKMKFDNGANIDQYENVRIATAEEVLSICGSNLIVPVIELKDVGDECIEKLFNIIEKTALPVTPFIISFDGEKLLKCKEKHPEYIYMYLVSQVTGEDISFCEENGLGIDFDANNTKNSDEIIKKIVDSGIQAAAWTIDDIEQFDRLVTLGINLITSNVFVP